MFFSGLFHSAVFRLSSARNAAKRLLPKIRAEPTICTTPSMALTGRCKNVFRGLPT